MMLKLVAVAPRATQTAQNVCAPQAATPLRSIAFLHLDPEFERYLASHLRASWPLIEIRFSRTFAQLPTVEAQQPQLIICGAPPTFTLVLPTIWLSEIERSAAPVHVAPNLWKTPMPITGAGLIRTIKLVLAAKTSA